MMYFSALGVRVNADSLSEAAAARACSPVITRYTLGTRTRHDRQQPKYRPAVSEPKHVERVPHGNRNVLLSVHGITHRVGAAAASRLVPPQWLSRHRVQREYLPLVG